MRGHNNMNEKQTKTHRPKETGPKRFQITKLSDTYLKITTLAICKEIKHHTFWQRPKLTMKNGNSRKEK